MSTQAIAGAVSRALARGGSRPLPSGTPYSREGLRVKRGHGHVEILADIDNSRDAADRLNEAIEILSAAGYTVQRQSDTRAWILTS